MAGSAIITKKIASRNGKLKANQRAAKKAEKRTRLFDFRTKIYKLVHLESNELMDATDTGAAATSYKIADIPADPAVILQRIRANDVIGLGGGGFPAGDKIAAVAASPASAKYLVVNAVECDPGLLHDEWLLANKWQQIELGIWAVSQCVSIQKILVASRHDVHPPITTPQTEISFAQVDYFYPMGEEHLLIEKLLQLPWRSQIFRQRVGFLC